MVDVVADLHLHSKYSRAVSPQMTLNHMARVAQQKGIQLLATGDWTHPMWVKELQENLKETEEGIYGIKGKSETRFLLSVEIATIFSQNGKGRRVHQLLFVPSLFVAEKVNKELLKRGCNLSADGRPIIALSSKNLLQLVLEIDEGNMIIPAHAWTPWFGIYGQRSGFNSLEEAYGDLAPYIYGIETGLCSDPEMNWQMQELEHRSILSFSDAHSLPKIGREATAFGLKELSYENIRKAIMRPRNDRINRVLYTIEFYPEEGKYYYSGHRNCGVSLAPEEQEKIHSVCPVCGKKVTDGVMRRVQELTTEKLNAADAQKNHPPFFRTVPLQEIISESIGSPVTSAKVQVIFDYLCEKGLSELHVLLQLPLREIQQICLGSTSSVSAQKITAAIQKVRTETIMVVPGYDGVYGKVQIWKNTSPHNQIGIDF